MLAEDKDLEQKLQERQLLYNVLETLPAMICILTPDYKVIFANRSFREKFGESHGRRCYEYCFGRSEPCDFCETFEVLRTGKPHRWEVTAPDGTIIEAHDFPFTDVNGSPLVLEMDVDITVFRKAKDELEDKVRERTADLIKSNEILLAEIEERKRTERRLQSARNKLRAMAAEVVIADERSRQHFATDLHDTVVQTMGAAKLRSQLIQDKIPEDVKPLFSELQEFLSQSITQARMLMSEMSPPVLYELGFVPALEWLTEQISNQHNLSITFEANGTPMLLHEIQVLLFQATRELLMNIVKHSGAKNAVIKVSVCDSDVKVKVKDDGKGFNKQDVFRTDISSGGFGLFSIRERLKHFEGNLSVRSKPGQGTDVTMTVPRITGNE